MKNFILSLIGSRRKKLRIVAPTVTAVNLPLRLNQWRRSPELVNMAAKVLALQECQAMMSVLRNESPSNLSMPAFGVQPTDRMARASLVEGYHLCLNNMEALAKHVSEKAHIDATFEPPEDTKE